MKIYKQIIATGIEWKPCIHCGKRFVFGEIITALTNDSGHDCRCWYCAECFERYWFSPLPVPVPAEDDDFCMVFIEENKLKFCPKRMKQSEYMQRKSELYVQDATIGRYLQIYPDGMQNSGVICKRI